MDGVWDSDLSRWLCCSSDTLISLTFLCGVLLLPLRRGPRLAPPTSFLLFLLPSAGPHVLVGYLLLFALVPTWRPGRLFVDHCGLGVETHVAAAP